MELDILTKEKGKMTTYRSNTKLRKIEVRTSPNGYTLNFDGSKQPNGYMYFNIETLLEGFFLHIGMGMLDMIDPDTMNNLMQAAANHSDIEKCIVKIDKLQILLNNAKTKHQNMAQRVILERAKLIDLVTSINDLAHEFRCKSEIANRLAMVTRQYAKTRNLTMKDLGSFVVENE